MRVLITGASGFIATNLIRRLLIERHEVHCVVRNNSNLWRLDDLLKKITLHRADLGSISDVNIVFADVQPEWLFHLSATRAPSNDFNAFFHGNVVGAANLIAACQLFKPERVVVYGSSLEYGHREYPLSEDMLANPITLHGSTKLCATHLFIQAYRTFQLPVIILRLFSVYGPWESVNRLLPKAILSGIDGRSIHLTPPGIKRDYIYVDDVIDASLNAIARPEAVGEIINVGSGIQTSNEILLEKINELTENKLIISGYDYPRHETDSEYWVADMRKCRALLGWEPKITLIQGLQSMLTWVKQHRHLSEYS